MTEEYPSNHIFSLDGLEGRAHSWFHISRRHTFERALITSLRKYNPGTPRCFLSPITPLQEEHPGECTNESEVRAWKECRATSNFNLVTSQGIAAAIAGHEQRQHLVNTMLLRGPSPVSRRESQRRFEISCDLSILRNPSIASTSSSPQRDCAL